MTRWCFASWNSCSFGNFHPGHPWALVCSRGHRCCVPISLQKRFASSLPPTAKWMEWLKNNYFLLSLISKKGIQMEAEAGNVGLKSRAQTGTKASKSGSHSVQPNQILLWTIASWGHYQDGISLWWLLIRSKLEKLPNHCQWWNSKAGKEINFLSLENLQVEQERFFDAVFF